jgi:hypothetical protein
LAVRAASGWPGEILGVAAERTAGGIAVRAAPVSRRGIRELGGVHAPLVDPRPDGSFV